MSHLRHAPRARRRGVLAAALMLLASGCTDHLPLPLEPAAIPSGSDSEIRAAVALWQRGPSRRPFSNPTLPDAVLVVLSQNGERCDVSVVARSVDGSDYRVARAEPVMAGVCAARILDLEPGVRYVYSARNAIIEDPVDYQVWPNFRGIPWDDLPEREGVIFVQAEAGSFEAGTAERLLPENLYLAYQRARPVPQARNSSGEFMLLLPLRYGSARTVTVSVPEAQSSVFVYAMGQLDPALLPPLATPVPYPPAIGWYGVRTQSSGTLMLPREVNVVVEGRDEEDITYSGLLPPFETFIELRRDPGFFFTYYIVDPYGDSPTGTNDIGLVRYGTEAGQGGVQTDNFRVKIDVRNAVAAASSQFGVELTQVRDAGGTLVYPSIRIGVRCFGAPLECEIAGVDPAGAADLILGVTRDLTPAGDGWLDVRVDFTGISFARLRIRGGVGNSVLDMAPDVGFTLGPNIEAGYAHWIRTTDPGTSWHVPW
jgi:hypothetical protein